MIIGAGDADTSGSERSFLKMKPKKRSKEEIQKDLKQTLLDFASEIEQDRYFIDNMNWKNDIISEGDEMGYIKHRDTGERTLTIRFTDLKKGEEVSR